MALASTLTRKPLCYDCRSWLLQSFTVATGLQSAIRGKANTGLRRYHETGAITTARAPRLSSTSRTLSLGRPQHPERVAVRDIASSSDTADSHNHDTLAAETQPQSSQDAISAIKATGEPPIDPVEDTPYVPWYLQQQSSTAKPVQHTAAGQEPPELPDHPPALLKPITTHVLETLGLTHLRILDLRNMTDPSPALGANLLMVIATARSERHLHASADKLCRWLRTEYKLTPFADGLLGRNEMKIAVRRRARRAKMMSAVGAKSADDGDLADGLRSDWICVNVGRVEGGVLPDTDSVFGKPEVIGFGTANTSSTLVVQMMTDDKREDIDLEGLWLEALRRQNRKKQALLDAATRSEDEVDKVQQSSVLPTSTNTIDLVYQPSHSQAELTSREAS